MVKEQARNLAGPPRANQGSGPPSCTTPRQLTIEEVTKIQTCRPLP